MYSDRGTMDAIRDHARLVYDIFTFNFEIDDGSPPPMASMPVPEELLENILYWVRQEDIGTTPRLQAGMLKNCALVCRYWARQSRRYIFSGKRLHIRSLEHAQMFREYALHGSPKLLKVCDLIRGLSVSERFSASRSFLDLVHLPTTHDKLRRVEIRGPFPPQIQPLRLDTPHWNLTNVVSIPPTTTAYRTVDLSDLTFPSFAHLVKYLKYFHTATRMELISVKWSDKVQASLLRPLPVLHRRRRIDVQTSDCPDGFLVGWQAITMYADSFIHSVVDRDQQWALDIMSLLRDHYEQLDVPGCYCQYEFQSGFCRYYDDEPDLPRFRVFVKRSMDYPSVSISLWHSAKPSTYELTVRGSPKPMRIVGLTCHIGAGLDSRRKYITPDLTRLRRRLEERCALRVVAFAFSSFEALKTAVECYPSLREPWPHTCIYILAYHRELPPMPSTTSGYRHNPKRNFTAIDPTTLEATGENWKTPSYIVPTILTGSSSH